MSSETPPVPTEIFDRPGEISYAALRQMYQQTLSPMRLVDRDLTIIIQNPAMERLTKYPTLQAIGRKCYEIAQAVGYCHTDRCPNAQIFAGQQQVEQTYDCHLWNGDHFPAWVLATPFYNDAQELVGSLQVIRDETHMVAITSALEMKNEELARHLQQMQGYNEIIQVLNRETRLQPLATATLRLLPRFSPAVMGLVYLFDETNDRLVPIATHAVSGPTPEFILGDGLPGEVALNEQPIFIDDVPSSYFSLRSGTGETKPSHLACLPIQVADRFVGVLEVAGLKPLSEFRIFLEDVARQLGIAMRNALIFRKTEEQAAELQAQNERLESQNEELRAQSEELIAQSEEIQSQSEELIAQRDALERKTMEADEANRMKSVFLSNMSHELRTPLNAILGLTRLMMDGVAGAVNDQQGQYLEVVLRNGNNLLELINDILDLSRIETGREEVRFDQIHLRGFLESLSANIRSLAERQKLTFNLQLAPEVSSMVNDERKLGQILTNLMTNAIKFTPKGGAITLEVTGEEREGRELLCFAVNDTGIGIAPEHTEIIFEPFRQIDGSASRKYGGSGLGLSICKKLVALLGGEITVRSTLGQGSSFTVILPRDRRGKNRLPDQEWQERLHGMLHPDTKRLSSLISFPASDLARETKGGEQEGDASLPHILLVDDDMISVRELGVHLREAGYRISFCLDGKTGLRLLEKQRPDLVLLDLVMPVMDGYAFLREMRRLPSLSRTPVVILSAMDIDPNTSRQLPPNVRGVLAKGNIVRADLIAKVRQALGQPSPQPAPAQTTSNGSGSATTSSSDDSDRQTGGRHILIAEDNPDNMFFLEEILKANGYDIRQAGNGKEALRIAADDPPGLILMDIQMPDMSGLEAVQAIRANPSLRAIPIVAITARAMKGDRQNMLDSGCDDYISKPVEPDVLLQTVTKWLKK